MEHLSLMELYQMKWRFKKENRSDFDFLNTSVKKVSTHLPGNRIIKKSMILNDIR